MKGEFDFIHSLKSRYSLDHIGDDCAVLPKDDKTDLVITADMLVEDIDFRLDWTPPEFLGHKSLAVSLSDIAAMGATPKWAMLSIGIPESLWKTDFLDRFYAGLQLLADQHGVEIIGGDISRVSDKLVIDSTVLGGVAKGKAVLRSGAKPGDAIFVTGFLGGAAAGLKLLQKGRRFERETETAIRHLLFRQLQPIPQAQTGKLLLEYGLADAMLDLSDGLSSDLQHLTSASNVGARIDGERIPVDPAINAIFGPSEASLELALHGGEDFELLFTVDQEKISAALDLGFHLIGEMTANVGIIELTNQGEAVILEPKGYRHF
jgi:thiamine-monophosphate kinase